MRPLTALALFCLVPLLAHAEGEVYRWKDANGLWHYSDQPQPGAELVKAARKPSASGSPAPQSSAPPVVPAGAPMSDAVAQQVRGEAAAAKADQCRKATEAYDKSIQARRMFRVDEKGNQVFLNDAELDQARLNARSAKDQACG